MPRVTHQATPLRPWRHEVFASTPRKRVTSTLRPWENWRWRSTTYAGTIQFLLGPCCWILGSGMDLLNCRLWSDVAGFWMGQYSKTMCTSKKSQLIIQQWLGFPTFYFALSGWESQMTMVLGWGSQPSSGHQLEWSSKLGIMNPFLYIFVAYNSTVLP